jgi:hypothetical protein
VKSWSIVALSHLAVVIGVGVALLVFGLTQLWAGRRPDRDRGSRPNDVVEQQRLRSKPPADDEWVIPTLLVLVAAALSAGYILVNPRLATGVTFGIIGLAFGSAIAGLILRLRRGALARGAGQALLRAALLAVVSVVSLTWTLHTTYDGLSLSHIRIKVQTVRLGRRISVLNNTFHGRGSWLAISIALGVLFVVGACLISVWAVLAALAMSRVRQGSSRRGPRTLSRFHTTRQAGRWANAALAVVCGFVLCSGLALYWTNPVRLTASAFDLGPSTKHPTPPSKPVHIDHVRSAKKTAVRACTNIDALRVAGSTFLHGLSATDGEFVGGSRSGGRAAPIILATRPGADAYIRDDKGYISGVRCLYRQTKSPLIALRIDFVSHADIGRHGFDTSTPGRSLVSNKDGVAQLPSRATKPMVNVVKGALALIRYG